MSVLNIQDGCPLSWSKTSAERKLSSRDSQAMKVADPFLDAWAKTLESRSEDAAILDERGTPTRTFRPGRKIGRGMEFRSAGRI